MKISKLIDKIFEIGVLIKSLFGFFEILVGMVFAVSGKMITDNFLVNIAQQEIADDPNDIFANYIIKTVNDFSAGTYLFTVVYLIFHGLVNLILAMALLKNKIWIYPWSMAAFGSFIVYQIYRYFHTHSFALLFLIAFDVLFVALIFLEYNKARKKK
jgi:uncharacterized membrane protein